MATAVMQPTQLRAEERPPTSNSDEELEQSLEKAQSQFLDALKTLGEVGKKSLEKKMPEFKEKSEEILDKSHKLLEKWRDKLEEELSEQLKQLEEYDKKERRRRHKDKEDDGSIPLI